MTARNPEGEKRASRLKDFAQPFSPRGFLSHHARPTDQAKEDLLVVYSVMSTVVKRVL